MTEKKENQMTQEEAWDHLRDFAYAVSHPGALHEGIKCDPVVGKKLMEAQKKLMLTIVEGHTFCLEEFNGSPITPADLKHVAKLQAEISLIFREHLVSMAAKAMAALNTIPVNETLYTGDFYDPASGDSSNSLDEMTKAGEVITGEFEGTAAMVVKPHEYMAMIMTVGYEMYGGVEAYTRKQVETLQGLDEEMRESVTGVMISIVTPIVLKTIENSHSRESITVNALAQVELVNAAFRSSGMNFMPSTFSSPLDKFDILTGMAKGTIERALGLESSFEGHRQQDAEIAAAEEAAETEALMKAQSFVHPGNGTVN